MAKYNWTVTDIDAMPFWSTLELVLHEIEETSQKNQPKKGFIDEFLGI